jgi:trans-aconitate 2-methyltransferase
VTTAILGAHLDRLPEADREGYVDEVLARLPAPVTIDYVRLNLLARRT